MEKTTNVQIYKHTWNLWKNHKMYKIMEKTTQPCKSYPKKCEVFLADW